MGMIVYIHHAPNFFESFVVIVNRGRSVVGRIAKFNGTSNQRPGNATLSGNLNVDRMMFEIVLKVSEVIVFGPFSFAHDKNAYLRFTGR